MHVLVVGGSGLIGRACVDLLLQRGVRVTLLTRTRPANLPPGVAWQACDVVDAQRLGAIVREAAPQAILHLAALLQFACASDPVAATRINVDGTLNVLEAARHAGVPRVVFGSSIAVYGQAQETMTEEGWIFRDTGLYGVSKLMGEALGARYQAEHGLRFVALRYGGVFGAEQDDGRPQSPGMSLVRKRILQCALGRDVEIPGATGDEFSHLTHVDDAAEATWAALRHPEPAHTVYNVAGPPENHVSLRRLHEAVRELAPAAGAALWTGAGKTSGLVDTRRLREDLGFEPRVSLQEGLRRTLGPASPA